MMDFVDTSAWFAYFVPDDHDHDRVRSHFRSSGGTLLTTDYCVDETLTLLVRRGEVRRALEAGQAFFQANVAQLHVITANQIQRAWILFQTRASAGWSFTDCTSKVVIDDFKVKTAVSVDAHFQQFGILVTP